MSSWYVQYHLSLSLSLALPFLHFTLTYPSFTQGTIAVIALVGSLRSSHRRLLSLGLALLVAPFIPASGLFMEVGYVVAERLLYSPSMGYCLICAVLAGWLYEKTGSVLRWVLLVISVHWRRG